MGGDESPVAAPDAPPRQRRGRPVSVGLADQRREQLTRAAYEVFVEFPYEEAPVSEIARRAGVGQGTLYRYVDGKRELLDLVVDWCAEQLLDAVDPDSILDAASADDPAALRAIIDDVGDRLFALVDEQPGLLRILSVQGGAVDRELRYRIAGIYNTFDALAVRVMRTATDNGWMKLDDDQIAVLARTVPSLALPGLMLALTEEGAAAKRAEYISAASDLARSGLLGTGHRG